LAARSPENREVLEPKLREYLALPEGTRNSQLNGLELRWYLRNLIGLPAELRAERVAKAPEVLRNVLQERLAVWDQMSTNSQKQILANEVIDYLVSSPPSPTQSFDPQDTYLEAFFNLPEDKQQKALNAIQPQERVEVNKTLTAIRQLPPNERAQTMAAVGKFAKMNEGERRVFMDKVNRWKKMSTREKEAWRNLAKDLPDLPPLPPGFEPPGPPPLPQ
jgi:hypothetical protein